MYKIEISKPEKEEKMNKVISLCTAGVLALSFTGCTCCENPCCGPNAVVAAPAPMMYEPAAPVHHKHHRHHPKHHHKCK